MEETFNPQEEAFMDEGDKMTAESEALARGEKTIAEKKAKAIEEGKTDEWFEDESEKNKRKF